MEGGGSGEGRRGGEGEGEGRRGDGGMARGWGKGEGEGTGDGEGGREKGRGGEGEDGKEKKKTYFRDIAMVLSLSVTHGKESLQNNLILPLLSMIVTVAVTGPAVILKNSVGSAKVVPTMSNCMQLVCGILVKESDVVIGT